MKAPYPSQTMSFWLSALVWTAWILIVLVIWGGLGILYLAIAAITGLYVLCTKRVREGCSFGALPELMHNGG